MRLLLLLALMSPCFAELKSGPPLPYHPVPNWAQLPAGWNFGECAGVDVDRDDNVWVFNRGPHPVIQFDKNGKMLQAWNEVPVESAHGIQVDADGNIWTTDVKAHRVLKSTPRGRVLMMDRTGRRRHGRQRFKGWVQSPHCDRVRTQWRFLHFGRVC